MAERGAEDLILEIGNESVRKTGGRHCVLHAGIHAQELILLFLSVEKSQVPQSFESFPEKKINQTMIHAL